MSASTFSGLKFRSVGPAFTSGRIADFAVNPNDHSEFYVAAAAGHVWKTTNAGVTWKPVFDKYGAYSIGVVTIDPNNTNVVWIGTGENNHQRAIGYGNGVYKSEDGGKSWKNMGLKDSRHIGGIVIDPRNSNIVFVAAEGSIWGPGGDRGLYKTTDGGKNWKKVLEISENTGVNNVVIDPVDPDIMYATSEQRRRHVWTHISGGPESAVFRSLDGGETWEKIMKGLPHVDIGGMGIAVSPVDHNVVYLIVEAEEGSSGFFRSTDRGASWKKMSDYHSSGQYYNEIYCDPKDVNKVYSPQTVTRFTEDGGKTWKVLGNNNRHVDDHAMWIDPDDPKHFLIGGDGGVYVSYDGGKNYDFFENLPVTQFYRVNVDNDFPFYNIYGGTQDNSSFGGPSQTLSRDGIVNSDWYVTNGGDGFWTAIDPTDPNIVYAEAQYGNMVRYDRKSGEGISIRPEPRKGEKTYKWNWNTPLIISPHNHKRLYTAANKVFRSDDQGNSWQVISDDITAQIDRNSFKVMGKYWSIDAVRKDVSTSLYGTAVSLVESPVKENLLYVGTDDGVIQRTEDAMNWTKFDEFPDVPKYTYVSDIFADRFDENVVYASFDNRKRDDFKPYILKSTDKGETWESISGNLPDNGTVHSIEQDFVNPNLLFAGTEFGIFFTLDGGEKWIQLKSGIPDVAV
ncbi:MAG: glycosyl hydrolase, partial [Ignavibacteria bacterium]